MAGENDCAQAEDVVELLLTRNMNYDVACAMDFELLTLYDIWVARDLQGQLLSGWYVSSLSLTRTRKSWAHRYPYAAGTRAQELVRAGNSFPVYSCWNGIVALSAEPFVSVRSSFQFTVTELACCIGWPSVSIVD